jgi:FlaA1/EpsC-like NDP-sugar epimerase
MSQPKRILITGVTGTLGTTLTRLLLKDPSVDQVIGISRDEQKQRQIPTHPKLKLTARFDIPPGGFEVCGYFGVPPL